MLAAQLTVLGALLWALTGCQSEAEQRARADAERMRRAVSSLRDAANPVKRPLLTVLSGVPCEATDVCELKRVCVDAYRVHVSAYEITERVRRDLDGDAGEPLALLRALESAEQQLLAARVPAERCTSLEGEVMRRHRL